MILSGDFFVEQDKIKDSSIQLIFSDLPYGVTAQQWDKKINLEELWKIYRRILTPTGVCIFTATQPFVVEIINSNPKWYKYSWYWIKNQGTNFFHAKRMPIRKVEEVLIFYHKKYIYNPQIKENQVPTNSAKGYSNGQVYHGKNKRNDEGGKTTRFPDNTLYFNCVNNYARVHPNEKPLSLCDYLIKTYSNEGDLVLDGFAGSGNFGLVANKLNRKFILCEKEEKYFNLVCERLNKSEL